jgi:isopenicillin N synthase-like dioxygenase
MGDAVPKTHPYFFHKNFNSEPNMWPLKPFPRSPGLPEHVTGILRPRRQLAKDILKGLAQTFDLGDNYFDEFASGAVATIRLLHHPS